MDKRRRNLHVSTNNPPFFLFFLSLSLSLCRSAADQESYILYSSIHSAPPSISEVAFLVYSTCSPSPQNSFWPSLPFRYPAWWLAVSSGLRGTVAPFNFTLVVSVSSAHLSCVGSFLICTLSGQENPPVIAKLSAACPGQICGVLAGAAITPLLAAQPECSQQDHADAIIGEIWI